MSYVYRECPCCGSSKVEANGYCATYNQLNRKADRAKTQARTPINKISAKRKSLLPIYAVKKEKYLFDNPWCEYHGKPCQGVELHHKAGREGFIDIWAEEHDVPALIDERYFCSLCPEAHKWATENSRAAIAAGISVERLSNKDITND
jgi:hypothetical protein